MKKIAVIGGGLAGLSAAYTLLQSGTVDVTLFEAKPFLGGRTQTRSVKGMNVDFGGFLIYPWYRESQKLFRALAIEDKLIKTPLKDIYYFLDDEKPVRENEIPFSMFDTLNVWSKSILKILPETDLSNPDLERFDRKTVSEYLRSLLNTTEHAGMYETFFDLVNQGYCYGPATKSKIAFMAPFVRQTTLHGDIHAASYFPNGMQTFSNRITEEIRTLGGIIHLNTPVVDVEGLTINTEYDSTTFDGIVFAQTVSDELSKKMLPDVVPEIWYTHFLTVAVELSQTPMVHDTRAWGATFYISDEATPFQALSTINLASLYGPALDACVTMNIILRNDERTELDDARIRTMVETETKRLFPNCEVKEILEHIHWTKTMPVAQESFAETIRARQGISNYYFAGDFLGAPCMETAIATGVRAANFVLKNEE